MPRVLSTDGDTATVMAGSTCAEVAAALESRGLALPTLASLPHISIGGAIATCTHGSGDAISNFTSWLRGAEWVRPDGSLGSAEHGDDALQGAVLGAVGVLHTVTLAVERSFCVRQDVYLGLGWAALERAFDAITSAAYSVSLFTRWDDEGVTQVRLMRLSRPAAEQLRLTLGRLHTSSGCARCG